MIQKFYIVALGGAREKHDSFWGKVKLFSSLNSGSGKLNTVKIDLLVFFLLKQVVFGRHKFYLLNSRNIWNFNELFFNVIKMIRSNAPF